MSTASRRGPPTVVTGPQNGNWTSHPGVAGCGSLRKGRWPTSSWRTGPLFPGTAVESVTDSSRYFVIRIEDGNGRRAFIGIGFGDRGDAFDFNVALQDHFKWVKQQCEFAKQAQNPDEGPKLDLGFKEGQTIKINIANMRKKEGAAGAPRTRPASAGGLSLLPPPPGGKMSTLIPPSGEQFSGGSLVQPVSGSGGATELWPQSKPAAAATADIWGDFTKSTGSPSSQSQPGTGWVQF
ncbi:NECAP endocytosis associated 2, isoform CRA_b [Rattus norvegicus]|uniref:NECAP endocytosis associated 2, isoform CRA_b n=1 Tax=Rattus norvegicus TaxID=10116 RepID=A6ITR1_RAT|nr:NECAP endocytosis associated 2, isoform CRA_b [Rattus norvegicus]